MFWKPIMSGPMISLIVWSNVVLSAASVILLISLLDYTTGDELDDTTVSRIIDQVRSSSDFARCWSLPHQPELYQEDDDTFELRLQECENYYRSFLARRFLSWGVIGIPIRIWTRLIDGWLGDQPMARILEIINGPFRSLPELVAILRDSFADLDSPGRRPTRSRELFVLIWMKHAFEYGDGLCFELSLHPMDRFFHLFSGLDDVLLAHPGRQMSDFVRNLVTPSDTDQERPGKRFSDLLLIYLLQHLCIDMSEIHFHYQPPWPVAVSNHLNLRANWIPLMMSWADRVAHGRCSDTDLYQMKLAYRTYQVYSPSLGTALWGDFWGVSNQLFDNCLNMIRSRSFFPSDLDQHVTKQVAFRFYKTSWDLLLLLKRHPTQPGESVLDVLNIRRPIGHNMIDNFFLKEWPDPFFIDAYTRGEGLCKIYHPNDARYGTVFRVSFIKTMDKFMSVPGFRPLVNERMLAFYYMMHVCEQARLLPLADVAGIGLRSPQMADQSQ